MKLMVRTQLKIKSINELIEEDLNSLNNSNPFRSIFDVADVFNKHVIKGQTRIYRSSASYIDNYGYRGKLTSNILAFYGMLYARSSKGFGSILVYKEGLTLVEFIR